MITNTIQEKHGDKIINIRYNNGKKERMILVKTNKNVGWDWIEYPETKFIKKAISYSNFIN